MRQEDEGGRRGGRCQGGGRRERTVEVMPEMRFLRPTWRAFSEKALGMN